MNVYSCLFLGCLALGLGICEFKKTPKIQGAFFGIMVASMLTIAIFRGEMVGIDYNLIYRDYFLNMLEQPFSFLFLDENIYKTEPIYGIFNFVMAQFITNPMVFFAIVSCTIVVLRGIMIWNYAKNIWFAMLTYIALGFFGYSLCTVRQELAISIAMFAFPFLRDRKIVPYFGIILLASLTHNSLVILFPIYWLALLPINKIMAGLYTTGIGIFFFFSVPFIDWFSSVNNRFSEYSSDNYFMQPRSPQTTLMHCILLFLCILLVRRLTEKAGTKILLNLYLFGSIFMIFNLKHFIFARVGLIFLPFAILLLPEVLELLKPEPLPQKTQSNQSTFKAEKYRHKEEWRMYYSMLGMMVVCMSIQYFFLLNANSLNLLPYVPFWS